MFFENFFIFFLWDCARPSRGTFVRVKILVEAGLRKFDRCTVKSDLPLHRRFAAKLSKRASLAPGRTRANLSQH